MHPADGLELVAWGVVAPTFRLSDEASAVQTLVKRYARDPADACLVRMSELHSDCVVLTFDAEFRDVCRRHALKDGTEPMALGLNALPLLFIALLMPLNEGVYGAHADQGG